MIAPVQDHTSPQDAQQQAHGRTRQRHDRQSRHQSRHQPLPRTRQRLREAQAALDRGEPTTCMVLLRVAIDTAGHEVVGGIETRSFVRMVASSVAGKRWAKKVNGRLDNAHTIIHGSRDATHREAVRALRLIRVIGGLWVRRVFGVDLEAAVDPQTPPVTAQPTPDRTTTPARDSRRVAR